MNGISSLRHPNTPLDEEQLYRVNRPLLLPHYHGSGFPKNDLEVQSLVYLHPDNKGWLTATIDSGSTFRVGREEDILLLFPSKYNFTYAKFNEMDCITKVLTRRQRASLFEWHHTGFQVGGKEYNLFWIPGTARMKVQKGGNKKTSRYLINLANFTPKRYIHLITDPFRDIRSLAEKFIEYNKYFPINLVSPASTTKDAVLNANGREFGAFEKLVTNKLLTLEDLDTFHTAFRGGRQETNQLGSFNGENSDLEKAYLWGLADCPGLYHNVLHIYRGTQFLDCAHPGSWYKVRAKVPQVADTSFPPIPFRLDRVYYPTGEFTTYISKPYVEMLVEAGIEFEILESCQIRLHNPNYKPFEELCSVLRYFEDNYKEELSPISVKSMHFPIVGHFLSIHEKADEYNIAVTYETSQDYNPLFACAIQGSVAKFIWEKSQVNSSIAIGPDNLIGQNLNLGNGNKFPFKAVEKGLYTILTPILKDHPGETIYRDLIEANRDKNYIPLRFERRISFSEGFHTNSIGQLVNYNVKIPPTGGNRYMRTGIKRIGELLEGGRKTTIPSIDRLLREGSTCLQRVPADEIAIYLSFLHQTQT